MKNVYMLSKEQAEELFEIQNRISSCVNLSYDKLDEIYDNIQAIGFYDETIGKIADLLSRIDILCDDMGRILSE